MLERPSHALPSNDTVVVFTSALDARLFLGLTRECPDESWVLHPVRARARRNPSATLKWPESSTGWLAFGYSAFPMAPLLPLVAAFSISRTIVGERLEQRCS